MQLSHSTDIDAFLALLYSVRMNKSTPQSVTEQELLKLESRLEEEVTRAIRYQHPLSCLFIDADHFKQVNDIHGHGAGDAVLRELALRVTECLRASDIATRFGGEEFALLLPQTNAAEAVNLAERIRNKICQEPIAVHGRQSLDITVSIGVNALHQNHDISNGEHVAKQLLEKADLALYKAKENGRNQVQLHQECSSFDIPN